MNIKQIKISIKHLFLLWKNQSRSHKFNKDRMVNNKQIIFHPWLIQFFYLDQLSIAINQKDHKEAIP